MKKFVIAALCCVCATCLSGCVAETTVAVNVKNEDNLSGAVLGKSAMIEIGDGLYYDSTTRIVYWWNGRMSVLNTDTAPSVYLGSHGLPCRYNPETNMFEEITYNDFEV